MAKTYPEGYNVNLIEVGYDQNTIPYPEPEPRFTIDIHKFDAAMSTRDNRIKELEYELEIAREALEECEGELLRERKNVDRLAQLLEWIPMNTSGVQLELPLIAR